MGRKNGNELSHTHTTHRWGENEKGWLLLPFRGAAEETGEEKKRSTKSKKNKETSEDSFPSFLSLSLVPLSLSLCLATPHTQPVSTDAPSVPVTPRSLSQTREGYSITLTPDPSADGGRFLANFARTAPAPPCARVTRPQITRNLVPRLRVLAL